MHLNSRALSFNISFIMINHLGESKFICVLLIVVSKPSETQSLFLICSFTRTDQQTEAVSVLQTHVK